MSARTLYETSARAVGGRVPDIAGSERFSGRSSWRVAVQIWQAMPFAG